MSVPPCLLLELTRRYTEPQRHYHGIGHIADMLEQGRGLALTAVQVLAIWFHDVVYDPTRDDNEEQSARLALAWLPQQGFAVADAEAIAAIVRDTKGHVPTHALSPAVIDLDLASLAAPWPRFVANTEAIRREYAHVPDDAFVAGRKQFFTRMLERPQLYWTPFGAALEPNARANLARSLRGG
ncbi:MAG: phosphohydrolase [Planctomycetes bacterium]|nr:phosphohydrolase [Planctomycetota bacterium]MCC7395627.1 phosphohydrolase [Planctomycetota bacterium]